MAEDRNVNTGAGSSSSSMFLDLAGSKLRNRLSSNLNESASAGVGASSFARRQLEKLGWKEGDGLGKNRDGISTHIRVTKRIDEQGGLGKSTVDENLQIGNEWWKNSVGDTLAKLGSKNGKKKKDKKKRKKKIFTDEELFEATGGARFGTKSNGMSAMTSKKGKGKRAETIADEEERKAKESVEWNGMTAPQVILSEPTTTAKKKKRDKQKRKAQDEDDIEVAEQSNNEDNEEKDIMTRKKKKRKVDKEEKKRRKKSDKKKKKKKKDDDS